MEARGEWQPHQRVVQDVYSIGRGVTAVLTFNVFFSFTSGLR